MKLPSLLIIVILCFFGNAPAMAAPKQITVVLGSLDNPFFKDIADGCSQWTKDNPSSDYACVPVGPAKSADATDEVKLLTDALATSAGIAVVPATPGLADVLKAKAPSIPVITLVGDFAAADQGLRKTWVATDDYAMGVALAGEVSKLKPNGGTICFEQNNPDAININARAAGARDTLAGVAGTAALTGQKGWTEVKGCPLYNKDDLATADKQLTQLLKDNPKIDAVVLAGGWAMFDAKGFAKSIAKVKPRLKDGSLVIVSGDTLPMQVDALKAGLVQGLVGQMPFAIGKTAPDVLIKAIGGETLPSKISAGLVTCTPDNVATCMAH